MEGSGGRGGLSFRARSAYMGGSYAIRDRGGVDGLFTDDFTDRPYWWDRSPRPQPDPLPLPREVDVAVVGSGYTGLGAALETARGGRLTLVLEAGAPGEGCSTRNGGQISTAIKPDLATLARRHGAERARAILGTGREALAWIGDFVRAEGIDCDFRVSGRFHAAHCPRAYERLARALGRAPADLPVDADMVPRAEQHREIATDAFHGGAVFHRHASLDPARFHAGLLARALAAGARVAGHARVRSVAREGSGFRLQTVQGPVRAREVVWATNGYTDGAHPWLRRRLVPIGSYMVATEPLPPGTLERLMPTDRIASDTRRVVYYWRSSPDRRRILFGGRVSGTETDPRRAAAPLMAELVRIHPELAGTRVSHAWMGYVAYTFDTLPHAGRIDGVHYAAGYCGSGVAMASFLGTRIGLRILGRAEGRTALDDLPVPTRPLYEGTPWFLAPTVAAYRLLDRLGR